MPTISVSAEAGAARLTPAAISAASEAAVREKVGKAMAHLVGSWGHPPGHPDTGMIRPDPAEDQTEMADRG
ncbi:hypothetical protein GCM10008170_37790 [Methylopila capsulata]|uniref:Uncharacterized protein n=1 Tax=Methylopila capsulata TaxID=61654 RepID=A0A9W6IYT9_9HYPH|nr:hypothetical protein GCM10008170_37790 [Methylopila capsulata]